MTDAGRGFEWFPFYVARFLGSRRVRTMNATEGGAFLFLLCHAWEKGSVPNDDGELEDIGRCKLATVRKVLVRCFRQTEAGWVNDRLETIRAEQMAKAEKASKSATARWDRMRTHSERNATAMPIEVEVDVDKKETRQKKSKPSWKFCPADWVPKQKHEALATKLGVNMEDAEAEFRDHEFKDPKTDADRAFSRWLRNTKSFGPKLAVTASEKLRTSAERTADHLRNMGYAS